MSEQTPTQDHGPLAAHLSDRTLDKVLSRPAHVPSLVLLDQVQAADHLANAADIMLTALGLGVTDRAADHLAEALVAYRAAVQS